MANNLWAKFLDSHFCTADEWTGNRPCDNGVLCDKCQGEWVQQSYEAFCKRRISGVSELVEELKGAN